MFSISVNLKDTRKEDRILKSSKDVKSIYKLLEIKDEFQVVFSFLCLLGHPVSLNFLSLSNVIGFGKSYIFLI